MRYLALGDSISIDDYTGVAGGGAVNQLAKRLKVENLLDLTLDGQITHGVLRDLAREFPAPPSLVTLTIGGNDFLQGSTVRQIVRNIELISQKIAAFSGAKVIMNTIYDPTDGDDALAASIGLSPSQRREFLALNSAIKTIAAGHGFLLCDLEKLFHGHGMAAASEPWIVLGIEPNLAGATAIADAWHNLLRRSP